MAETKIEWTESVWNPVVGCSVVSPGCTNCYAMKMAARLERMGQDRYRGLTRPSKAGAVWTGEMRLVKDALALPLRRRKPTTWFVNSMSDLFHESVPDEWIDRVFAVMALCPQHTFQVLTKRSARMRAYMAARSVDFSTTLAAAWRAIGIPPALERQALLRVWPQGGACLGRDLPWPLPNVWLGVSAEDQHRADERVPDLLATPAAVRFVSAEPLLGPIDFGLHRGWCRACGEITSGSIDGHSMDPASPCFAGETTLDAMLHWIIVGGESGPGARPMHPDWARQIRDACAAAGVAYLFKQWGSWGPGAAFDAAPSARSAYLGEIQTLVGPGSRTIKIAIPTRMDDVLGPPLTLKQLGKKVAGRLLDGVTHDGMPEVRHG